MLKKLESWREFTAYEQTWDLIEVNKEYHTIVKLYKGVLWLIPLCYCTEYSVAIVYSSTLPYREAVLFLYITVQGYIVHYPALLYSEALVYPYTLLHSEAMIHPSTQLFRGAIVCPSLVL